MAPYCIQNTNKRRIADTTPYWASDDAYRVFLSTRNEEGGGGGCGGGGVLVVVTTFASTLDKQTSTVAGKAALHIYKRKFDEPFYEVKT
jgi:hypothetical protein